jgi:hypothetical protein
MDLGEQEGVIRELSRGRLDCGSINSLDSKFKLNRENEVADSSTSEKRRTGLGLYFRETDDLAVGTSIAD